MRIGRIVLMAAACCWLGSVTCVHAGMINGDFESGDFSGWTQVGDTSYTDVVSGVCPDFDTVCTPHSGSFAAYFGNPFPGGVTQTITTVPGTRYNLGFWLIIGAHQAEDRRGEYTVAWDSTILSDHVDPASAPWAYESYDVVATGTSSVVSFQFNSISDNYGLDDVTVAAATPEPISMILVGSALIALACGRRLFKRG